MGRLAIVGCLLVYVYVFSELTEDQKQRTRFPLASAN